jgi:hypothetical protein
MSCRGVFFAIEKSDSKKLRKCKNDEELVEYIEENIEEEWEKEWLCETDKSWDAMHRCFAEGKLELVGGIPPLNSTIFGGEILNTESDYYVSLKDNKLVKKIGKEILLINREKLRSLYNKISNDYQGDLNDEDFDYTWEWFESVKEFYIKVAQSKRDIIFTVDQ